jgi:hypothetical protein
MKIRPMFRILTAFGLLSAILPLPMVSAALVALTAKPEAPELLQFTAGGHALGFAADGVYAATGSHALHVEFVGGSGVQPQSTSPSDEGQADALEQVTFAGLWDGIDLSFDAEAGGIYATTYTIKPGAEPAAIRLRYNAPVTVNKDGTLSIAFETGAMTESAPVAWQEIGGQRIPVEVSFRVDGQEAGFAIGAYSPDFTLFIDPSLTWLTFLGGGEDDNGYGIAVDGSGNVYVSGSSESEWGSPVRAFSGHYDAYAAKLDPSGNLSWVTFLGGSDSDYGRGIALDASGNVHVTGFSNGTWGSPLRAYTGNSDAFIAKLTSAGSLTWNTFLGGSNGDAGYDIAVDGDGNIYVTGRSLSSWGSPVRAFTSGYDAFAAKLASTGGLTWHTFLGGSGDDEGKGIAVDGDGNVYVGGSSEATWGSPVRAYSSGSDAFAAKLDSAGGLTWNTFLGGSGDDKGEGIAVDGTGDVYVGGYSDASWGGPVRAYTAGYDTFAAKLDSAGGLTWNTFMGGSGHDFGRDIEVDAAGITYLTGYSNATWGNPVRAYSGGNDTFAVKVDAGGGLTWNTFLGGSIWDEGRNIAVDGSGNVYVAGKSESDWGSPVRAYSGADDALAVRLNSAGGLNWNTFLGECGIDYGFDIALDASGNIYVSGLSTASWESPVRAYTAGYDAFAAKFDPAGSLTWVTFLGGTGEDHGNAIDVDGDGNVSVVGKSDAGWGSPVRAYSAGEDAFAAKLDSTGNLIWNTFLGASGTNKGDAVAVDASGNVHVAGSSNTTWGSPVRAYTGGNDAFAAKLDSAGNLIWNTFLGGSGNEYGRGVAVDGTGNVYAAGFGAGSWGSPVRAFTSGYDAFAAKLTSAGGLTWNTFLGGVATDFGYGIAVDGSGNVHVTGTSAAPWGSPVREYTSGYDTFAAKLDSAGTLTWNTFLGGSGYDAAYEISIDNSGDLYLAGSSDADWGSPDRAYTSGFDGYAAKVDTAGTLIWNTFLGGSGDDAANSVVVNGAGTIIYAAGTSDAKWGSPVRAYTGNSDAFAVRMDATVPGAFGKTDPAEGAYVTTDPTLSWGVSSGADSYEYCIDTSDNGACDASWISTGTAQSAALSGLTANTAYYWQVRAINTGGTTLADGGTWWPFTALPQSFGDVPTTHWAWSWIERLFAAGITSGCGSGNYCPNNPVTRAEMAIFLERGIHGSSYTPPAATGTVFGDVPISHWAADWIEQLSADGITSGCGGGNYCPNNAVTRAEMAIFLLRSKHGSSYTPPAATGTVFGDVPISHWAAAWIEQLAAEGITSGCGGGNYCPNQSVTRAEMAIFLVRTFDLP